MFSLLFRIICSAIEDAIRNISGPIGIRIRRTYYRYRFKRFGRKVTIETGVYFTNPNQISVGDHVWIDKQAVLIAGSFVGNSQYRRIDHTDNAIPNGEILVGSFSHIGIGTVIQGHSGVEIGEAFTSSARCSIYSLSNDPALCREGTICLDERRVFYVDSPIKIGRNVWLGLGCVVLGGSIGDDCFAKPYSLLSGTYSRNKILGGNPAIELKPRLSDIASQ